MSKKSEPSPDFPPITAEPAELASTTLRAAKHEVPLSEVHALQDERRDSMSRDAAQSEIAIDNILAGGVAPLEKHEAFQDAIAKARLAQADADAPRAKADVLKFAALSIQERWDEMVEEYLRKKEISEIALATLLTARDQTARLETAFRENLGNAFAQPPAMHFAEALVVKKQCIALLEPAVAEKRAQLIEAELALRTYAQKTGIPNSVFESQAAPDNEPAAA